MSVDGSRPFSLPNEMAGYLAERATPPDAAQQALQDETRAIPGGGMQLGHQSTLLMTMLVQAARPRFVVEIGTFTGYSSLAMARALPDGARLLCCDVSDEWTTVARRHWAENGVDDRVELTIGPAIETITALPPDPPIDLAFIDADKTGYIDYYEQVLARLSRHGLICVDNTMWSGRVLDDADQSADTVALRAFNDHVAADARTRNVTIPVGDGITMIAHA